MFFLTFSDAGVQFVEKELRQSNYTTIKVLPITMKVKLIDKKEFASVVLNKNVKMFMVHVATLLAAQAI